MTLNIFKIFTKNNKKKKVRKKSRSRVDPLANFGSMPKHEKNKFAKKVVYKAQHPRHKSKIEEKKRKMKKAKTTRTKASKK